MDTYSIYISVSASVVDPALLVFFNLNGMNIYAHVWQTTSVVHKLCSTVCTFDLMCENVTYVVTSYKIYIDNNCTCNDYGTLTYPCNDIHMYIPLYTSII